ncbi:GNAT family N-acetyltransferase [Psychrobacillus sp. NPDC058041]|uniref:GNAT family N-acetyltransferase n=1 Tax=Psychrobacillus sp. NPDC058041 TaxID=3346310 RepID=UPI0036DC8500
MITLAPYEMKYQAALENYPLSEEHLSFTAHPLELLDRSENTSTYSPIVILENGIVVGFFVLDSGEDKFNYTDKQESILLRGYSVHPSYQGNGIAKKSMGLLREYSNENFPHVSQIVLGVNEANKAAQSVYLRAGFIDEGKRFNGRSGVQIAMCLKL